MPGRYRRSWLKTATRPLMLAAVMVLLLGGCGVTLNRTPRGGPISVGRMLPARIGLKLDEAALRKRAELDSFPTPAEAGLDAKVAADAKD